MRDDTYGSVLREHLKHSMSEPCSCGYKPLRVHRPVPLAQWVVGILAAVCFVMGVGHEIFLRLGR
jgi:hypothetical protein